MNAGGVVAVVRTCQSLRRRMRGGIYKCYHGDVPYCLWVVIPDGAQNSCQLQMDYGPTIRQGSEAFCLADWCNDGGN